MADPQVSIIIPTPGNNPLLQDCLASIKNLDYPVQKIQTLVITNADLEKTRKPWSFAASVNLAASKAKGEYLVITNDDIVFQADAISAWVKAAAFHPNAILGANLRLRNSQNPAPAGYTMNPWTGIARPVYTGKRPTPCDWVSGCTLFIPKTLWKKLNGFDEDFAPGFFEDADLCFRAKAIGAQSVLWPQAKASHAQTETFNRDRPKKYAYWYRNKILFLRKHASPAQLATSLALQYALFTPARAVIRRDGRLLPALKGLIWNFTKTNKENGKWPMADGS